MTILVKRSPGLQVKNIANYTGLQTLSSSLTFCSKILLYHFINGKNVTSSIYSNLVRILFHITLMIKVLVFDYILDGLTSA